jgi:hypothetical protein
VIWLVFALLLFASPAWAACTGASPTWTTTPDRASMNTCLTNAVNGDTVNVLAGDVTWTTPVTSGNGKAITIVGAGIDSTIIRDGVTVRNTGFLSLGKGVTNWADPFHNNGADCQRLSGISFRQDTTLTLGDSGSFTLINLQGCLEWSNFLVENLRGKPMTVTNGVGVFHHGEMRTNRHGPIVFIGHPSYKGVGNNGDWAWAQPTAAGGPLSFYFEEMTLWHTNECDGVIDSNTGNNFGSGRYVVRHSRMDNGAGLVVHPTGHDARVRGGRLVEAYRNRFFWSTSVQCFNTIFMTNGSVLVADNDFTGFSQATNLDNWRSYDAVSANWLNAAGHGKYDVNPPVTISGTSNGNPVSGPGAPCEGNPVTQNAVGESFILRDSTKNFTALTPGVIWNVTRGFGSKISSFTATTVTHVNCGRFSCVDSYRWCFGDAYEIRSPGPYPTLDQIGWASDAQTTYLPGTPPSPSAWPNGLTGAGGLVREPLYQVGNRYTNVTKKVNTNDNTIKQDRDFYMEIGGAQTTADGCGTSCLPFTGASGTGSGRLAQRPTSCTTGVAYWATNEGTWDSTVLPSGKMYVCTATNTWTARWGGADNTTGEPYTYPHPLITGVIPPPPTNPSAPTGFEIVP